MLVSAKLPRCLPCCSWFRWRAARQRRPRCAPWPSCRASATCQVGEGQGGRQAPSSGLPDAHLHWEEPRSLTTPHTPGADSAVKQARPVQGFVGLTHLGQLRDLQVRTRPVCQLLGTAQPSDREQQHSAAGTRLPQRALAGHDTLTLQCGCRLQLLLAPTGRLLRSKPQPTSSPLPAGPGAAGHVRDKQHHAPPGRADAADAGGGLG